MQFKHNLELVRYPVKVQVYLGIIKANEIFSSK